LDTRTLTIYQFDRPKEISEIDTIPPLALSPDGRGFVRFVYTYTDGEKPALAVFDFVAARCYTIPIDRQRMLYTRLDQIIPAWVSHHFAWERDSNGIDRLIERKDFKPLVQQCEPAPNC
jgi:hypothetical protein